jgi:dolichyl-phosphate-mannose-protein mannosyltransferase
MSLKKILRTSWEKFIILCGVLGVLLPTSPVNMPLTYRDSGVFLYAGWRILNGEIPYRDIWDHKPPMVYYINALGLWLSNNSRWGVWWIECFILIFAATTGYYLFKKAFGTIPSLISLTLWLLTLAFVIEGGNLTEEYALPLQFLALWLAYDINKPNRSSWHHFLIGLLGSVAFFTKQSTIGIWIAIIIYSTTQRFASNQIKRWGHDLFYFSAGIFAILCFMMIFFSVHGALLQFWSAGFDFNFVYSSTNFTSRLWAATSGLKNVNEYTGLFQFSMLGYIFALTYLLTKKNESENQFPLLVIGIIALPIELMLVSISGRSFPHYYVTILPILSLFAGVVFWVFCSNIPDSKNLPKFAFTIGVIGALLWASIYSYYDTVSSYQQARDTTVIDYIKASTTQDDYVLLWGAEAYVNYFAQRKSPTRYFYLSPLYAEKYVNEQMINEFLKDIIQNKPRLIIDTKNPAMSFLDFPIHTTTIDTNIAYIKSHYYAINEIGSWTIYKLMEYP